MTADPTTAAVEAAASEPQIRYDYSRIVKNLLDESDRLAGLPGAGMVQGALVQAAGLFAVADAVRDLARALAARGAGGK